MFFNERITGELTKTPKGIIDRGNERFNVYTNFSNNPVFDNPVKDRYTKPATNKFIREEQVPNYNEYAQLLAKIDDLNNKLAWYVDINKELSEENAHLKLLLNSTHTAPTNTPVVVEDNSIKNSLRKMALLKEKLRQL